jgi:hypothetical protein
MTTSATLYADEIQTSACSGLARPQWPGPAAANHGMTRRAMMATCSAHWAIHRELSGESGEMQLELETAVTIADSGSTRPPSGGSGPAPPGPRSRAAPGRAGVSGGPGLTGLPPNFQAPAVAQSGHSRWHGSTRPPPGGASRAHWQSRWRRSPDARLRLQPRPRGAARRWAALLAGLGAGREVHGKLLARAKSSRSAESLLLSSEKGLRRHHHDGQSARNGTCESLVKL